MAKGKGKKGKTAKQKREDTAEQIKKAILDGPSSSKLDTLGLLALTIAFHEGALKGMRRLMMDKDENAGLGTDIWSWIPGVEKERIRAGGGLAGLLIYNLNDSQISNIRKKSSSNDAAYAQVIFTDWMISLAMAYVIMNISKEISISEISSIAAKALPL